MTDAKFRWFEAMYHDEAIPLAQRAVIGYCGVRYAKEDQGFVICVTQKTVADNLGVSRKTVNMAFGIAARRGWLTKVAVHKPGTGNHGADTWTLTRPKWCNRDDTREAEWSNRDGTPLESDVTETAEWCNPNGQSGVTENAKWCNPGNASTSENDVPKGLYQGFKEGFLYQGVGASGAASAPDDPFFGELFGQRSSSPANPALRHVTSKRVGPETNGHIVDESNLPECVVDGCTTPAKEGGMCGRHFATSQTYGGNPS